MGLKIDIIRPSSLKNKCSHDRGGARSLISVRSTDVRPTALGKPEQTGAQAHGRPCIGTQARGGGRVSVRVGARKTIRQTSVMPEGKFACNRVPTNERHKNATMRKQAWGRPCGNAVACRTRQQRNEAKGRNTKNA